MNFNRNSVVFAGVIDIYGPYFSFVRLMSFIPSATTGRS